MHLKIHSSKYMTTREVIRVLNEVSIASSGPTQSPESAAAVIRAAALLSAAVNKFSELQTQFCTGQKSGLLFLAPSPGCQKNNPPARSKYSRSHPLLASHGFI